MKNLIDFLRGIDWEIVGLLAVIPTAKRRPLVDVRLSARLGGTPLNGDEQ